MRYCQKAEFNRNGGCIMFSKKVKCLVLVFLLLISNLLTARQSVSAKSETSKALNKISIGKVDQIVNDIEESVVSTITHNLRRYYTEVSPISEFFDYKGNYNTIFESENSITLVKYSKDFKEIKTKSIKKPYSQFGGAITDAKGNYYIVYGEKDVAGTGESVVISVVKYNSDFEYISEVNYTGAETRPYTGLEWGTCIPFWSGNCDIALNGNILVCTYGRLMYSGHQSNHVIFVNTDTMTKVNQAGSYTSHSFDQRVLVTKSGDYIFVDQGDAYERGFNICFSRKGSTNLQETIKFVPFHFREGSNRNYGYNETYAQLAGIAEIDTGYVFAGASEKTLSLEPAKTNRDYCGDSEARNLFIQILKKDFMYNSGQDAHVLQTEVRKATGSKPLTALTSLYLKGNVEDYGILWLTDYTDEYGVINPKLVTTEDDRIVLLWEKFKYETEKEKDKFIESYYIILSKNGEVLKEATPLHGIRLTQYESPVYRDNIVYFSTLDNENKKLVLNRLYLEETIQLTDIGSGTYKEIENQDFIWNYVKPDVNITIDGKELVKGVDYELEYYDNYFPGKSSVLVKGKGDYYGEKTLYFYIKPENIYITDLASNKKGSFTFATSYSETEWFEQEVEVVYSTDKNFKNKKVIKKPSGTVSNLKSNKTYYVKARTYIMLDGVKFYGDYSNVSTVKVK